MLELQHLNELSLARGPWGEHSFLNSVGESQGYG